MRGTAPATVVNAAEVPEVVAEPRAVRWWREALAACGAFEWVAFAYLGISGALIAISHRNLEWPALHLALRAAIAAIILTIAWAASHGALRLTIDRGRVKLQRLNPS